MKRREFITLLGGAIALPRAARAQQPTIPRPLRIGMVHPVSPKGVPPSYVAFFSRLRELGYVEGDTLAIEYINLEGHLERYDEAMRDLVRRRVDLIFALGQEDNLRAAMAATSTVPIVMLAIGYDPLARGYVSSLARPTGNVTGIYVLSIEAIKKRLQLFKDAFPQQHAAFGFWDFDAAEAWRAAVELGAFARHRACRRRASRPALRLRAWIAASCAGIPRRPVPAPLRHFYSRRRPPRSVRLAPSDRFVLRLLTEIRRCGRTHVVRRRPRGGGTAGGRVC